MSAFFGHSHKAVAIVFEVAGRAEHRALATNGQTEEGTSRGLDGIAAHRYAAMLRYDDSIDSCSFGCASYRAEVSYVGNTVEEHHKGEHAIFVELCGEMVEPVVCDRRQDRQHTLMVLRVMRSIFSTGTRCTRIR